MKPIHDGPYMKPIHETQQHENHTYNLVYHGYILLLMENHVWNGEVIGMENKINPEWASPHSSVDFGRSCYKIKRNPVG